MKIGSALNRSKWVICGIVLIPVTAIRWLAAVSIVPATPYFDKYVVLAKDFFDPSATEPFTSSPIYSAFLGILLHCTGDDITIVRIIHLIMGGIGILMLTWAACSLWDHLTGLIAGCLAAVTLPLLIYDSDLVTTGLETLLTAMLILSVIRSTSFARPMSWFFSGVLLGLLAGIRPNSLLLIPVLGLLAQRATRRIRDIDQAVQTMVPVPLPGRAVVIALVGVACAILPITALNYVRSGEWIPVTASGGAVLYSSNNYRATGLGYSPPPALTEIENTIFRDAGQRAPVEHTLFKFLADRVAGRTLTYREASARYSRDAIRYLMNNPWHSAGVWTRKAMYLVNSWEVLDTVSLTVIGQETRRWFPLLPGFGLIAILSVPGVVITLAGAGRSRAVLMLLCLPHVATGIVFYVNGRLRAAMLPALILFAAFAFRRLLSDVKRLDANLWIWIPGILLMATIVSWEDDVIQRHRTIQTPAFLASMEGLLALQQHDTQSAEAAFAAAAAKDPFNAREAWANLATIYSGRGDAESAERSSRHAAGVWSGEELDTMRIPSFAEDRLSAELASALNIWREGNPARAANRLTMLLASHPGHPDILYNLAVYAANLQPPRCDHAVRLLDQALEAGLKYEIVSTRARRLKARCLSELNEPELAQTEIMQANWEERLRPESLSVR